MVATLPKAAEMFSDVAGNSVALAERFESYKSSVADSIQRPCPLPGQYAAEESALQTLQHAISSPDVVKSLSPELIASVEAQLGALNKDLTLTNPIGTGLVAYDLEAPSKKLFPRPTPLRNRIARKKGIGTAKQFKVISGISGSGTGGVASLHPGISSTPGGATNTAFGPTTYIRGPKISYAGYEKTIPYKEFGVSDSVPFNAQFSGQGFEDLRSFSQTAVLWSTMLLEERVLVAGRGTDAGFSGALGAPAAVSVTTPAATGSQVANTGALANVWVKVTAVTQFGESVLSAAATSGWTAGDVIVVSVDTEVAGATGYRVYVSTHATTDPGDAARFYAGTSSSKLITIQGALPTTGRTAANVTTDGDTTGQAKGYDGILAYCMGADAGYRGRINSVFSSSNPGKEFTDAFAAMYTLNLADPDEILLNGIDRKNLSDRLKASSSNPYRIVLDGGNGSDGVHGATLGALAIGMQNQITGKDVSFTVHPFLPQGVAPIISWQLPLSDTNVSDCWEIHGPQDYMAINWPVLQFSYDVSTYYYNSLLCYAPAWQGSVAGIIAD